MPFEEGSVGAYSWTDGSLLWRSRGWEVESIRTLVAVSEVVVATRQPDGASCD